MTAEEILKREFAFDSYGNLMEAVKLNHLIRTLDDYAESLAKERERDTSLKFAEYIDQKYQLMIDGSIKENFDTFLAEKRKGGEGNEWDCDCDKDHVCGICHKDKGYTVIGGVLTKRKDGAE